MYRYIFEFIVLIVSLDKEDVSKNDLISVQVDTRNHHKETKDGVYTEPCRLVCRSLNCLRLHAGRQQNCSAVLLFQQSYDTFSKRRRGNHIIQRDESRQI